MAFAILSGPFSYFAAGTDFGFSSVGNWVLGNTPAQQSQTYQLNTTGIGSLTLIPDVSVTYNSYGSGVNGVVTWLTYAPSGSIKGPTISVYEAMGSFAYYNSMVAQSQQLIADLQSLINQGTDVTSVEDNWFPEINLLVKPGVSQANNVATYFANEAQSMASQGFSTLAQDASALEAIANEWTTPVYYLNLNQGAGWQQVSSSAIDFGIDLTTVNGALSTYSVSGASGSLTVTGFTAVGYWNGDPNQYNSGNGYYDIVPAETDGWLDVTSYAPAHDQTLSVSQLISQVSSPGSATITSYILWDAGTGGAQLSVNGVVQPLNQNITLTASQLSQAQYRVGSGTDVFWVQYVYSNGSKSVWQSLPITGPIDTGPVVTTVGSQTVSHGAVLSAASLVTGYSDPFGDAAVQYDFWDSGAAGGGGYFQFANSILPPFGPNQNVIVSASALSNLQYHSGSGTDTLWVKANDGTVWGAWTPAFAVTAPIDTGPTITGISKVAVHGQSYAVSTLLTYSDPVGSAATQYDVWDSGAQGAHFLLSGTALSSGQDNYVAASQLSSLTYQSGSGTDTLWVRANDGTVWGTWSSAFTITAPVDTGPVEAVSNRIAVHGQSYSVSSLFSYSDPFGSSATEYDVWDTGTPGGNFVLNGVGLAPQKDNYITASQLSSLTYQSGSGTDTLWIRANDGTVWGSWSNAFTIAAPIDTGPTETVSNKVAVHGQSYAVSSLFSYSDPFGSVGTMYDVWDTGTGGGHFVFNGQPLQPNGDNIFSAVQLPYLTYQSGSGTDTLWVRAYDGTVWGNWSNAFTVTAPIDTGPVVTPTSSSILSLQGQTFTVSSLFTYSDPFGSTATAYDVWDTGGGGGYFALNGSRLASNQDDVVPASQLAQLTYHVGSGTDTLWIKANDGTVWGAWSTPFTVSDPPTVPSGQTLEIASASSAQISFASNTGTLKLDDPADFSGTVAGMMGADTIDFANINFAAGKTVAYAGNNAAGSLSITDGVHTINVGLLGNYMASTFVPSSDGHGGTSVALQPDQIAMLAQPQHA